MGSRSKHRPGKRAAATRDFSDAAAAANPPVPGDRFDPAAADRVCAFFELFLTHTKGEHAGKPFIPSQWQRWILRRLFGWFRPDGTRRYRRLYLEVPRKNGKSTFAAGIALYLTFADGEVGAECYSAAADKDQATIVFAEARRMVEASPELAARGKPLKSSIFVPDTGSIYRVLSRDVPTKHGLNPHGIVIDELHALPDRELYDVLTTGQGARRQPLTVLITTAGYDRNSLCWEQHEYARAIIAGTIEDPSTLAVIFAAEETDNWHDEEVWAKANPGLGVSVRLEFLRDEHRQAAASPARENAFRRLYLNQWTEQDSRWIPLDAWDDCKIRPRTEAELAGQDAYGGLDVSNVSDIAALVWVFPRLPADVEDDGQSLQSQLLFDLVLRLWIPRATAERKASRTGYLAWERAGLVRFTEGDTIDQDAIAEQIAADAATFNVRELAYDPWQAVPLAAKMRASGIPMFEHRQGFVSMSSPSKGFERAVLTRRICHGGHKVLRWAVSNAVATQDPAGNLKPSKERAAEKIDPVVALIMGLGRAELAGVSASVYDRRGMPEL